MYAIYSNNRHVGYALRKDQADQIIAALYYYGNGSPYARGSNAVINPKSYASKYAVPAKWADKWLPVFFARDVNSYWGRFLYPWNQIVADSLNQYFVSWSSKQKPWTPAATTRNVGDSTYAGQQVAYATDAQSRAREVCAGIGRGVKFFPDGSFLCQ
jgi:hypothetical protein